MRSLSIAIALALVGCGGSGVGPSSAGDGERVQAPVESACTKESQPMADFGLVTRTEFSGEDQAKVVVVNAGGSKRRVEPKMVAFCRGPCGGGWTSCTDHRSFTPKERARYDVTLAQTESIELIVDARLDEANSACEKAGLFLIAAVDQRTACADVGTWIALGK